MGRAKGREKEEKGDHEGKRGLGGTGQLGNKEAPQNTRTVQDEEEEVGGEDECREANVQRDLRQLEERRREQEEEADEVWHRPSKEQRIAKWRDCGDNEQEEQEETAEEKGERKVREEEVHKRERREKKEGERRSRRAKRNVKQ